MYRIELDIDGDLILSDSEKSIVLIEHIELDEFVKKLNEKYEKFKSNKNKGNCENKYESFDSV